MRREGWEGVVSIDSGCNLCVSGHASTQTLMFAQIARSNFLHSSDCAARKCIRSARATAASVFVQPISKSPPFRAPSIKRCVCFESSHPHTNMFIVAGGKTLMWAGGSGRGGVGANEVVIDNREAGEILITTKLGGWDLSCNRVI